MSKVVELPRNTVDRGHWVPTVGSRVRIAHRATLEAALRARPPAPRPIPAQLQHGGSSARVEGVRFDAARRASYRLSGLPGEWQAEWLQQRDA